MANKKGSSGFTGNFFSSLAGNAVRVLNGLQRNSGLQSGSPYTYAYDPKVVVTEETALQLSAVYAAVRLYVDTISALPIMLYKRKDDGSREAVRKHWALDLLDSPNGFTTTREDLVAQLVYSLVLNGNSYAVLKRAGGRVRGITPVMPSQIITFLDDDETVWHRYTHSGSSEDYGSSDMLHVKLFGNGIVGLSPIKFHQGALGIATNTEKLVTDIYATGKASGVLTIDAALTDNQRALIKQNFEEIASNPNRRLQVLEAGMQFQQLSLSPQDMDLIAARRYSVSDIARIFSLPSVLLDNNEGGVYTAGIAPILDSWYRTGLAPVITKIEAALNRALFRGTDEQGDIELRFDVDHLLRADVKTRADVYNKLFTCGAMSVNEIRRSEGLPSVEHGDEVRVAVNVMPISQTRELGQHNTPPETNNTRNEVN